MPDKDIIRRKLAEITKQLRHIEGFLDMAPNDLFGKESNLYFAERSMERLIGSAIDINMHLVSDLTETVPQSYFTSFMDLAKAEIIPYEFAKNIARSTSLRNILVHEYEEINPEKFQQALKDALEDYTAYAKYIQTFL